MPSTEAGVENSANKRADADGRSYLTESPPREQRTACLASNWSEFIWRHMDVLTGTDFFTVEVPTWRGLVTYVKPPTMFVRLTESRELPHATTSQSAYAPRVGEFSLLCSVFDTSQKSQCE